MNPGRDSKEKTMKLDRKRRPWKCRYKITSKYHVQF